MLFNSFGFLFFFPLVCLVYFLLPRTRWRNLFLLATSYYFYMNWKPVYALLILTSTLLTYGCGLLVERHADSKRHQKAFLAISFVLNFGILFLFKYYNFFGTFLTAALAACGLGWQVPQLDVLLPVGISFYTFQAVGYSIDVYRGTIRAERDFFTYALFVSFFPQLVAGPIERAKNLLPQFQEEHSFVRADAVEGCRMMLWGYFMKVCVSDSLAQYVDKVYSAMTVYNSPSRIIATLFFTFQIYCDFAGYSLIARGAARVMGFRLMENFRRPYLALSVKDFWKRWHISLSSWFMDYLYIPLGGNRVPYARHLFNLFFTFLVSGLWHGADWTFVIWGAWHGAFIIIDNLLRRANLMPQPKHWWSRALSIAVVFTIAALGWLFFRASCPSEAFYLFSHLFSSGGEWCSFRKLLWGQIILGLLLLIGKDIKDEYHLPFNVLHSSHRWVRYVGYYFLSFYVLVSFGGNHQFIYFQF